MPLFNENNQSSIIQRPIFGFNKDIKSGDNVINKILYIYLFM